MAKRNKKYQKGGDFWNKAGEVATNYGLGMADTVLGTVGMSNVIKDDQYKGAGSQFFKGYSDVAGAVGKAALPMAANIIAPGSGQLVSAGQQVVGQFNPQDPSQLDKDPRTTQMIGNSLGTIAGPAMQMAMMRNGGQMNNMAELEKDEAFRLPNGRTIQLNNAPSHEQGGIVIPNLPEGTRILSDKLKTSDKKTYAEAYKPFQKMKDMADKLPDGKVKQDMLNKANTKFEELYNEQETMKEQKFVSQLERDMYRCGGMIKHKDGGIYIKPSNRGKFTAAAKRAGMSVQAYADHILANKEDFSSTLVKRANFANNAAKWEDGGMMNGDPDKLTKAVVLNTDPTQIPQGVNPGGYNHFQKFLSEKGLVNDPRMNTNEGRKLLTDELINEFNSSDYVKKFPKNAITPEAIKAVQEYHKKTDPNVVVDSWVGSQTSQMRYPMPRVNVDLNTPGLKYYDVEYGNKKYALPVEKYSKEKAPNRMDFVDPVTHVPVQFANGGSTGFDEELGMDAAEYYANQDYSQGLAVPLEYMTNFARPTSDRETGFADSEPKPTFTNIPSEGAGSNIPWQRIAGQAALGIGQNIGNIYDLARANKVEDTSYTRINPAQLSPTAALNYNNVQQRKLAEDIKDASVGKSSTYLNARRDAAINAMRTNAQIREDFENKNAMLRQQAEQYNAATSDRESDANAMNRATARNIKGHAYSNIGQNIMGQTRDVRMENRDQDLLNIIAQQYPDAMYNPALKSYYNKIGRK